MSALRSTCGSLLVPETAVEAYDKAYAAAWDAFMREGVSVLNAADQSHLAGLTALASAVRQEAAAAAGQAAAAWLRGSPLILDGSAGFIADNVEAFIVADAIRAVEPTGVRDAPRSADAPHSATLFSTAKTSALWSARSSSDAAHETDMKTNACGDL